LCIRKSAMKNKKGFTLIEIMVVIAVVAILAAAALVNSGKNADRDVRLEAERLKTFLRDVQNKSLQGEVAPGTKTCGFGVRMNNGNVQSYYVSVPNLDFDCLSYVNSYDGDNSDAAFVPRNGATVSFSGTRLFFLIPSGKPYLNGSDGFSWAVFNLSKGGASVTVQVSNAGEIRVQ